jgi:hypothetical protein
MPLILIELSIEAGARRLGAGGPVAVRIAPLGTGDPYASAAVTPTS